MNFSGRNKLTPEIAIPLPENHGVTFIERKNRFVGLIERDGQVFPAHVPSSGRMRELLFPGNTVYVTPMSPGKRTDYRILLAKYGETVVSVDSLLPNHLIYKALTAGAIRPFKNYNEIKKEVNYGESRIDLLLKGESGRCLIEVKSVTLVDQGVAKFPDAPSTRGVKHLGELARASREGYRTAVIFVIQREDATSFSPNDTTDPDFGRALRHALTAGVEVYALACEVTRTAVALKEHVQIIVNYPYLH